MPTQPEDNQMQELKSMVQNALTKIDQIKDELPRLYVSRADFDQRQDAIEENTRHISEKLDSLAQGLPDRFLDRAQYLIAHSALEKRVETAEGRHEDLRKEVSVEKQRVSEMYASGMQRVNDTFTGIRNLIAETRDLVAQKSEATEKQLSQMQIDTLQREQDHHKQASIQLRVALAGVVLGALLSFIGAAILHAMHLV